MKKCIDCPLVLPQEEFPKKGFRSGKQRFGSRCITCQRKWQNGYVVRNKVRLLKQNRQSYQRTMANTTKHEERKRRQREYYAQNPEKFLKYRAKHYHKSSKSLEWRIQNAHKNRSYQRLYRERNKVKLRDDQRTYRIARHLGHPVIHIPLQSLLDRDGHGCYICHEHLTPDVGVMDHLIPLSRGGDHVPENVKAACTRCNNHKGDKTLTEYMSWLSQIGPII